MPWHSAVPCLSFPIYGRGQAGGAGRRVPGIGLRAGPHKILGLFSNLESNPALPLWSGPAAVMNELSGS